MASDRWRAATIAGIAVGVVYALSPLTVLFVARDGRRIVHWSGRGVEGDERTWLTRDSRRGHRRAGAAVAGLFLSTDHARVPFGSFFGDEEYFIKRSMWLRNVGTRVCRSMAPI